MTTTTTTTTTEYLFDSYTGEMIRPATPAETAASIAAAEVDGGYGAIEVDGRNVYVMHAATR